MVTARHEAMHRIFREDPGVFARAFRTLEIPIPAPTGAAVLVTDVEQARSDVPLATLSAITHAWNRRRINAILNPLSVALRPVDEETGRIFAELTELGLGRARAARTWSR